MLIRVEFGIELIVIIIVIMLEAKVAGTLG